MATTRAAADDESVERNGAVIDFLTSNYLWIAAVVFLVAMRRGGGCGGHHGHRDHHHDHDGRSVEAPADEVRPR